MDENDDKVTERQKWGIAILIGTALFLITYVTIQSIFENAF